MLKKYSTKSMENLNKFIIDNSISREHIVSINYNIYQNEELHTIIYYDYIINYGDLDNLVNLDELDKLDLLEADTISLD